MSGRSALSYLVPIFFTTCLIGVLEVLNGSWTRNKFYLSVLVIIGLSCISAMFVMGVR